MTLINRLHSQTLASLLFAGFFLLGLLVDCRAETYFVNNQTGSDDNNGLTKETSVSSIAKAIQLAETSDRIVLHNTGVAYREPMIFRRLGGRPDRPFVVEGNGAVLSGLKVLDPAQWKHVKDSLYVFSLEKIPYGNPYLLAHGKRLPESKSLETLKPEQHFWDRETNQVYLLCAKEKQPGDYQLEATLSISGFTLGSASYILCRDLTCEYFSNDGFNIHGDCRGIRLENVVARYNGDDGISIHESGGLMVQNAYVHDNFYGIQDVNASRSVYNGVLAERNQVGVSLVGGYHSLVDCQVRQSVQKEIDIAGSTPHHLIGAEHNLLCKTILFAQNVSLFGAGNRMGLSVRNGATAIIEQSVITGSETGVYVDRESHCHLSRTVITDCPQTLNSASKDVFCDYNVYGSGSIAWRGTVYQGQQWQDYVMASDRDQHSKWGMVAVAKDGLVSIPADSQAASIEKKPGPTAPFSISVPQD